MQATEKTDIAVFDIGGTYFRSAIWSRHGGLRSPRRQPAINYLTTKHCDVLELQEALVDFIIEEYESLEREGNLALFVAGLSIGAPVDARSGLVLKSGPLWGPHAKPFDLLARLKQKRQGTFWAVGNDVTAAILRYVNDIKVPPCAKVLLITVSTGIGARLYDFRRRAIPLDAANGLQGEIGHLPVEAVFRGQRLRYNCECGGASHLNAYSSGRALDVLLRELPDLARDALGRSILAYAYANGGATLDTRRQAFCSGVDEKDPLALEILDFLTRPLAGILATILTHDPLVDAIVLTGGVVDGLQRAYVHSLNQQFMNCDMFHAIGTDHGYLSRRLRLAPADDHGGLTGAGYLALAAARGRQVYAFK